MSLTKRLQTESPFVAFPEFDSPMGFFSNLNEFADIHFKSFKSVEVYEGLSIYAGSPDESEITTDEYVKELNGVHFINKNKTQEAFDPELDIRLATIKVFISHDGAFLLKKYNSLKGKLKEDEVALFLEYSSRNIISNSVTLVLAGESAKKYVGSILKSEFIQGSYYLSSDKQEQLVESVISSDSLLDAFLDIMIQTHDYIVGQVSEFALDFFSVIESFFSETLRIPESFWNVEAEDSIMGQLGDTIEHQLKSATKSINSFIKNYNYVIPFPLKVALDGIKTLAVYALEIFQEARKAGEFFIALVCGIWNSVMDTIAGIFGLIKLVIKGVSGAAKMVNGAINYATKSDYYNALATEYLDNLLFAAIKINWQEVIQEAKKEMFQIAKLMIQLPSLIWDKVTDLNSSEVGYYLGYIIFELISFIFPPIKIAQLGKFGKWTKFSKIRKASNVVPEIKVSKAVNKVDEFFEFIHPLIKKMKQGTEGFKDFVRDILQKFRKWVESLIGLNTVNFPKFINNQFEILTKFTPWAKGQFLDNLKKISDYGVLILKGTLKGERSAKYFLNYKGVTIFEGTIHQLKKKLKQIIKSAGDDISKYLNRLKTIKAGTGGNFKYLRETESLNMVGQELPMSCAAACIKQIAKDMGQDILESVARNAAKTDEITGTVLKNIAPGLQDVLPNKTIVGGHSFIDGVDDFGKVAEIITNSSNFPWIASLKPPGGVRHSVIVDKISEGIVYLRDPWNSAKGYGKVNGMEASIKLVDFVDLWKGSRFHHVRIK